MSKVHALPQTHEELMSAVPDTHPQAFNQGRNDLGIQTAPINAAQGSIKNLGGDNPYPAESSSKQYTTPAHGRDMSGALMAQPQMSPVANQGLVRDDLASDVGPAIHYSDDRKPLTLADDYNDTQYKLRAK